MKVSKRKRMVRITCTPKQAQALAILLNCSSIRYVIEKICPGAFHNDPYKPDTWDDFKKAGIESSINIPGIYYFPSADGQGAKKGRWKFPIAASMYVHDALKGYFGIKKRLRIFNGKI